MNAFAETFMDEAMQSWLGYSVEDIIKSWGYPNDERTILDKHLIYWIDSKNEYVPQQVHSTVRPSGYNNNSVVNTYTTGGYNIENSCIKIIEIDKKKKIINYQVQGNNCPNFYFTGKQFVNPNNDKWLKKKESKKSKNK
jgi:hypothetical protein